MKVNLLPTKNEIDQILNDIGKEIIIIHKQRLMTQTEVDGGPMPSLSPVTEEIKRRKGGVSAKNSTKRMIDTGDFLNNAFRYNVKNNSLQVYISNEHHHEKQQRENFNNYISKITKGMTDEQKRRSTIGNMWNFRATGITYLIIAQQQERGEFGTNRNNKNPGAKFFGLNVVEQRELTNKVTNQCIDIFKKNLKNYLGIK